MIKTIIERRRQDRRRCPRVSDNLIVHYSSEEHPLPASGCTEDISTMGLRIISKILFSPREKISIELYQPIEVKKQKLFSIYLVGEITWTEKLKMADRGKVKTGYRLGVNFLEGNDEDIKMIEKYIVTFSKQIIPKVDDINEHPFF